MEEFVVTIIAGVILLVLGWQIWKNEKITLIHSYHYKNVRDENKKAYTTEIGMAAIIIAIGIILTGIVDYTTQSVYGWYVFLFSFAVGVILTIHAQIKYNGGIF